MEERGALARAIVALAEHAAAGGLMILDAVAARQDAGHSIVALVPSNLKWPRAALGSREHKQRSKAHVHRTHEAAHNIYSPTPSQGASHRMDMLRTSCVHAGALGLK